MKSKQTKPARNQKAYRKLHQVRREEMILVADAMAPQAAALPEAGFLKSVHLANEDLGVGLSDLVGRVHDTIARANEAQEIMRAQISVLESAKERLASLV